jgi:hypothetical protein
LDLFDDEDGADGILDDEAAEGPEGGRAGSEADAGGVADRDFTPLDMLEGPLEPEEDGPPGWKGRAMDDSFGLVVDDPAVEVKVLLDPAVVLSSVSVFSVSSSTGIVALGSIGNLRSRQSLTKSVI